MNRHPYLPLTLTVLTLGALVPAATALEFQNAASRPTERDVVVVGGTPGGIMAAIAAARGGRSVVLLERTAHVGGLPANGLGATDIQTRGATGGLFVEFVRRNLDHYVRTYGKDSPQARDASTGYHFEPSVGGRTLEAMLAEQPRITVLRMRQFDALPQHVTLEKGRLTGIRILNRQTGATEAYRGKVFIDATYEGDLAAAAGAPFRVGRESAAEFNEPMAGILYKLWGGPVVTGTTGAADNAVQAYNYRLPLTDRAEIRVAIPKPKNYHREEYASLVEDLRLNRVAAPPDAKRGELDWNGIGRIVNMVRLPNGKTDANNQHAALISTDLPEENWPWPTSSWTWRDRFAQRQRDYTLGLLWFAQNDPALPADFRERCRRWGLAKDEYADNAHFPRQVYVREGRRIEGEHLFTAHDALPVTEGGRPPIHATSITASHYALDSHACRKREADRLALEGFFSYPSKPYTVPYGVMVPKKVDGLLTPVPASATHIGFSTLRMEPCWMALGQAAGAAASLAVSQGVEVRKVDLARVQRELLRQKAVLIYYRDVTPDHRHFQAVQYFGVRGLLPAWEARPDEPISAADAAAWSQAAGLKQALSFQPGKTTRGEYLTRLLNRKG